MKNKILTLISVLTLTLTYCLAAEARHARVLELEKLLSSEAQVVLRDMIPGVSFNVKVSIEPLHRAGADKSMNKESLPYYEAAEEIRDEWDDPARTNYELLNRVNKISVRVNLPQTLDEQQINDIKLVLTSRLFLVDGRDSIDIQIKYWPTAKPTNQYTTWILGLGVAIIFLLGLVYFMVSSVAITRITRAIRNIKVSTGESSSSGPIGTMNAAAIPSSPSGSVSSGISSGQIQINDTLKMTEVILSLTKKIEGTSAFPTLEDMITVEHYISLHPRSAGALLAEFPMYIRQKLFSYSYSDSWLKALSDPGDIDHISFELMNKLIKGLRANLNGPWEHFLICCWRLNSHLPTFLKSIPHDDALCILRHLPQNLSIGVARDLMPGEWGIILKQSNKDLTPLTPDQIKKYSEIALKINPLRSFDSLAHYKKEVELAIYLKTADLIVEKEVYGAVLKDSMLPILRPPFFPVFEYDQSKLKNFVQSISLEDWSLAMNNIPRTQRQLIDHFFSDRQKFRFIELLKQLDRSHPSAEATGEVREKIAIAFQQYKKMMEQMPDAHPHHSTEEENSQKAA
ncbi:MAG: hypothetical protein FMNOHCHN_03626 [Ignavibacteriaceae bacterium]|nr:hypothetical protein [Ignavibacteriaceae bacterium]GIL17920.1 MAG: hypothetical protein BroJett040_16710 [Oligoflexia bacterium]